MAKMGFRAAGKGMQVFQALSENSNVAGGASWLWVALGTLALRYLVVFALGTHGRIKL